MTNPQNIWLKKIKSQIIVEIVSSLLIVILTFALTFIIKGEEGINSLIDSFGKRIDTGDYVNLSIFLVSFFLAIVFLCLHHFFNMKSKEILKKISKTYFDVIIGLYRIISTYLLGFSVIYIFNIFLSDSTLDWRVLAFIGYGILSLVITVGLVVTFEILTSRKERTIKKN